MKKQKTRGKTIQKVLGLLVIDNPAKRMRVLRHLKLTAVFLLLVNLVLLGLVSISPETPVARATTQQETFNSSTTWTAPAGVFSVTVDAWGGGGSASCGTWNQQVLECIGTFYTGGGGAYSQQVVTVIPGQTYTVTIAGDSWFSSSATVLARGANTTFGGQASGGVGTVKTSGGAGYSGAGGGAGGSGGYGGDGGNGGYQQNGAGGAGDPPGAAGGSAPGGGASGCTGQYGCGTGVGYPGRITLTYTLDETNPTVSTLSPTDNATGVSTTANLVIIFSEAVDAEAGANNDIVLKKTADGSTVETIDAQDAKVTGSGTATITINPATILAESTGYYVQIGADAFDDTSGNSYAGISDTTTWDFVTSSFPAVSTLSPTDNATGVSTTTNLVIIFSEAVDAEAGANNDIVLKKTADGSTVETIDAQDAKVTGSGTATITINPAAILAESTGYYVQIGADAFDDASGNSYAGISDTTTWDFTTAVPLPTTGQMIIYSKGRAFTREKVVEAVLSISYVDGKVEVQSFREVEVPETFVNCS